MAILDLQGLELERAPALHKRRSRLSLILCGR